MIDSPSGNSESNKETKSPTKNVNNKDLTMPSVELSSSNKDLRMSPPENSGLHQKPPQIISVGQSSGGLPLKVIKFNRSEETPISPKTILFLSGVHGNEIEGVWLLEAAIDKWSRESKKFPLDVVLFPKVNPDGVEKRERLNSKGVDLNRNLPTKDWTEEIKNPKYPPGPSPCSEPENLALTQLISEIKPIAILSAHSFSNYQININGPSRNWGEALSRIVDYPVTEDIGYPTPGCLGTYTGKEMGIPTITLEIERGLAKEEVGKRFLPLLEASIEFWSIPS